tara:strand:- start:246 stop:1088 length:843 start_codon:yes stop_codon:yes gene_type:complete
MKILSIDVGIKNLAFCLLETEKGGDSANKFKILKWDTINLLEQKKCSECGKPAKFSKNNIDYCRKHAKNCEYQIPTPRDLNIKRLNLNDIHEYIKSNDISLNILEQPRKNIKRANIIEELQKYNDGKFFDPIKEDNAGMVSLIEIGVNLRDRLDELLIEIEKTCHGEEKIERILIENQLSSLAIRMKTLQGMITQYFIMRGYENIEYVCSQNKLKLFLERDKNSERPSRGEKTSYSERKKLGIKYCQELLNKKGMHDWLEFMSKHTKRDDLADSFLQGIC